MARRRTRSRARPPHGHLGAALACPVDEAGDPASLVGGDERAHGGRLIGGIADHDRANRVGHPADEVIVYATAGDHPARRRAVLARVVERAFGEVGDHGLDVGVVEHDHRCLATQLEVHPLEGSTGRAGDGPSRAPRCR